VTAGVEVEVKLAVTDPAALRRLIEVPTPARLGGFEAAGPVTLDELVDRYFDTATGLLALAGARARLRDNGREVVVAVKHHGIDDGPVTARQEVEGPATTDHDPGAWPDSPARRLVEALSAGQPLVEIASLRQRRLVRRLRRAGTEVELSLDALEALDGEDIVGTRWELEAELKAGDTAALHELAAALQALDGVGPPLGSKLGFAIGARLTAVAQRHIVG
jgi:inorganic triphosphatase YgiF